MSTPMSHEPSNADNDITHVLNSSNIITLARLAAISASNADKVSQHLAHRLDCLLQPFFSSGTILWEILRTCNAVLSGSSALRLLLPITPATWKPNDLDLYVPHCHMRLLTTQLQNLGYQLMPPSTVDLSIYSSLHTFAIHRFILEDKVIDVIESITHASFSPIFFFHCMAVMNFIGTDSIFAVYPELTMENKTLLNPFPIYKHTYQRVNLAPLEKYHAWGFKFLCCEDSHASRFQCRSIRRSITDGGCLWIDFHSGRHIPSHPTDVFCQFGVLDVEWRLGGHICGSKCFVDTHINVIEDKS